LDGALSTTRALPAIAEAVGDALTVLADSGVRSGPDVVRMLALGAKGVLLGRAGVFNSMRRSPLLAADPSSPLNRNRARKSDMPH
jgi:isopentenyl diphosphate isomerase/L-lactate dehydrogenase-like FMN-dependent dehydrogenase